MPGLVIGKVAIKVLPDTDGFREKVKRDLNGKEKPGKVEVRVVPKLDDSAFRSIQRKLESLGDVDVRVSPEMDRTSLRQVEIALDGIDQVDVDVDPMMDWGQYRRAMEALEELSEPQLVEVGVWARMASFRATAARIAALTRPRVVSIKAVLDEPALRRTTTGLADAFSRLSGLRFTLESFARFRQEMLNLDRLVPKIGLFANGLGYLSAIALTAGGSLLSVSSGLIQMGAAGLALPGILGGIATGLGITAIALADFKKEVPQITSAWNELRSAISANFWDVAGDGIRALVDELFPLLTREAGKTATALGGFFSNLSRSLRGKLLPLMSEMFDNLNESIDIFARRTDAVANIIATLGKLGSKYLPRLATYFGDLTQKFSDFLSQADKAGKLTEWVDEGVERIKEFGRVIGATASIFSSLAEAAERAGGATLGSVADGLERVAAAASSPGFQRGLTDTLRAAYEMMDQISSRVGPKLANLIESLSETFQEMAPVMGDTIATAIGAIADALASPALQRGLKDLLRGFNRMVHELAPAMQPLADKIGALGAVVGELAETIGKVLSSAIEAVSPAFVEAADSILPLIDSLGDLVSGLIDDLKPAFEQIAKQLAKPAIKDGIKDFGEALERLGDAIGPQIATLLEEIVKGIGKFSEQDIANAVTVVNGIASALEALNTILSIGGESSGDNWFTSLIASILDSASLYSKLADIVNLFQRLGTAISNIGTKAEELGAQLGATWASIQATAGVRWEQIKTLISTKAGQLRTGVVQKIEGLRASVAAKFESIRANAVQKFESLKVNASQKFESIRSAVVQKIESLRANAAQKFESIRSSAVQKFESLRSGISSAASRAREAVVSRIESLRANLSGKWESIRGRAVSGWNSIVSSVSSAAGRMREAVSSRIDSVVSYMRSVPGRIRAALGSLGTLLYSAGTQVVAGLISGITAKLGEALATVSSMAGKIASAAKGALGIKSPSRVFMAIGDFTMQGLIKGIESKEHALLRTMKGLTNSMVDTLGTDVAMTISADAAVTTASVARQITTASRANAAASSTPASTEPAITIGNITIPLEDLKQLKDLEDFMELLRVRTRMG